MPAAQCMSRTVDKRPVPVPNPQFKSEMCQVEPTVFEHLVDWTPCDPLCGAHAIVPQGEMCQHLAPQSAQDQVKNQKAGFQLQGCSHSQLWGSLAFIYPGLLILCPSWFPFQHFPRVRPWTSRKTLADRTLRGGVHVLAEAQPQTKARAWRAPASTALATWQ